MPVFCEKCGFQNNDTARFCKGCGEGIIATTASGNLATGVILDKRYKIIELIKSGGMGAVYKALDSRFENTPCAVKEMLNFSSGTEEREYFIDRFKKEAMILHRLKHANLPAVKDYFVESGRYYLVMDYIEGKDLDTIMKEEGAKGIAPSTAVEWSIQILEVLDYLHSQNPPIIYRDLKPANIMLRPDGIINLIDFGIARTIAPGGESTMTGIGTPVYAPRELLMGKPEERSDIYTLAATMHSLLTGIVPSVPCDFGPLRKHKPGILPDLESIIMKALSADVNDRYENVKEMKKALEDIPINKLTASEETFSPPTPASPGTVPSADVTEKSEPSCTLKTPSSNTVKNSSSYEPTIPSGSISAPAMPHPPSPLKDSPSPPVPSTEGPPSGDYRATTLSKLKKEKKKNRILLPVIVVLILLVITSVIAGNNYLNNPERCKAVAKKAYEEKDFKTAKAYFAKVLKSEPDDIDSLTALGDIAQNIDNDQPLVIDYYEKLLEIDSKNETAITGLPLLYMEEAKKAGDSETAINYYKKVIEINNENKEACESLFSLYLKEKLYREAKEILDKLYSMGAKEKDKYLSLGDVFFQKEDYEVSIECFTKTLEIDPENIKAHKYLSECYLLQEDYEKVIQENKKILSLDEKDIEANKSIGNAYYAKGNYISANKWYAHALELNPDENEKKAVNEKMYSCYMKIADSKFEEKDYKGAVENIKSARKKNPDSEDAKSKLITVYLTEGKIFYEKENYEEAEVCFQNIVELKADEDTQKEVDNYLDKIAKATAPAIPIPTRPPSPPPPQPYPEPEPDFGTTDL